MGPFAVLLVAAGQIPPPPILSGGPTEPMLQQWRPGEVRCGAAVEPFAVLPRSAEALAWPGLAPPPPVTLRFRIDASGRPLSVASTSSGYVPNGEDIVPSLVASRFASGAERSGCTVTYVAVRAAMEDAPLEALMDYYMSPSNGYLPRTGWDRIFASGTCTADPQPEPLLRAFPAFRTLPATPGAKSWTMLGFDLDRGGRPVRVHRIAGTGNAPLDSAAIDAVAKSRFTPGDRTGCRYPYWRAPGVLEAPESPSQASLRPADATCPAKLPFVRQPTLVFPQPYQRRSIEGWATIAFDVAPWGAIGNARVLDAEPSAEFGTAALAVIGAGTKATSGTGYTGCLEKVRFRMGEQAGLRINGTATQPGAAPSDLVID